jgi:hypothetical protein
VRGSSIALATGEIDLDITRSKEPPTHDIADGGSSRRLQPILAESPRLVALLCVADDDLESIRSLIGNGAQKPRRLAPVADACVLR